ncbi:MAG: hypothetical protein AAFO98_07830 [Pseudomonadota bacterium]
MQLDPNKRYLLSRPRGGFNDAMVQLEKSRLYAVQYRRTLILDMSRSGLHAPFESLFTVSDTFGCDVILWSPEVARELDAAQSIHPEPLSGRVSTYEIAIKHQPSVQMVDRETGCQINFDHGRDHAAQILVYEQMGGGYSSLEALKRTALQPHVAEMIVTRLQSLDAGYQAVHIRHSDYKTDFEAFLTRLRPLLRGQHVLICSDSAEAKGAAAAVLDRSTTVFSVSDTPDTGGVPLHGKRDSDRFNDNVDLLTDLLAMSVARKLYFTRLAGQHASKNKCSGFSLLADLLGRHPQTIRQLLSSTDTTSIEPLLARKHPPRTSLTRWIHQLDYYRWNYRAAKLAIRRYHRSLSPITDPEKIPNSHWPEESNPNSV